MSTRKEDITDCDGDDAGESKQSKTLPVRRRQSTALLDAPKKGFEVAVERGASAYFSTCRRIASLLNRSD